MRKIKVIRTMFGILIVIFCACTKEDESIIEEGNGTSWTITVGAYSLDNGIYTETGNELIFDSEKECQTWSRTAQGDNHDSNSHLHYNAVADVSYNSSSVSFSWTEYGPEIDQTSIDNTCTNGVGGVDKTVTNSDYYQDKPNVYLKITSVIEN